MFPWQEIGLLVIKSSISILGDMMFWMVVALVSMQYWQNQKSQVRMFGISGYTLTQQVSWAVVLGILGGMIASFIMTLVGLTVNELGLAYIWPIALLLMLIHMRFICFAYAGGIVALSSLIFGWPEVNVPHLLALIGILHITESFLIFISAYNTTPLIIKKPNGQIVGGFSIQHFWPLPLMLLAAVPIQVEENIGPIIKMPDWWPLLPLSITPPEGQQWIYAMIPVVAALGYGDFAISTAPDKRRKKSAVHLFMYSIALISVAIVGTKYYWVQYVAALLSPLGHEALIQLDNKKELNGKPLYLKPDRGIMVLDTVLDTPAQKIGLKPGDIIYDIDGFSINYAYDLSQAITYAGNDFVIRFLRNNEHKEVHGKFKDSERQLGIILAPNGYEMNYVVLNDQTFWVIEWLKRKFNFKKKDNNI